MDRSPVCLHVIEWNGKWQWALAWGNGRPSARDNLEQKLYRACLPVCLPEFICHTKIVIKRCVFNFFEYVCVYIHMNAIYYICPSIIYICCLVFYMLEDTESNNIETFNKIICNLEWFWELCRPFKIRTNRNCLFAYARSLSRYCCYTVVVVSVVSFRSISILRVFLSHKTTLNKKTRLALYLIFGDCWENACTIQYRSHHFVSPVKIYQNC